MTDMVCSWHDGGCRGVVVYRVEQLLGAAEIALVCRVHLGDVVAEALDEVQNALGVEVGRA